jgi:hypothetical protein
MRAPKPQATAAAAALLAGLLVLGAGHVRAQDAPPAEEASGQPDEPSGPADPQPPAGEEAPAGEETAGEEAEEAEDETAPDGLPPAPEPGPAFGDVTYPPGTFPEWEPPEPEPEAEAGTGGTAAGPDDDETVELPPEVDELEEVSGAEEKDIELDAIIPTATDKRFRFQIQGLYELHFNVMSADYSANDWLAFWMLRGNFDVSKHDQLSLRLDLEQRFVADPGESGLWFGDIRLYYSRKFSIPIPGFPIPGKASVYVTFPTSRPSIERSYITKPTAVLALAPSWGPLTLVANGYFRYSIAKYAESSHRGNPNTMLTTGYMFQLIYVPVEWFAPSVAWLHTFSLPYETREDDRQLWQSNYYWEVALNFSVPMPEKAPGIDLSLAYAQGGNPLDDGVYRLYFAKRDQAEIYFGVNMIY